MGATRQAKLSRGRPIKLGTAATANAPTANTEPHVRMSPKAPVGLETTGFFFGLVQPAVGGATPIAAGFTITVWVRNPVTKHWFAFQSQSVGYNQAWVTFDVDAAELYFQIAAASVSGAGNVYLEIWEQ